MNKILILSSILFLSVFATQINASNVKYYNNFRQTTDAEPKGSDVFVTAKGGVIIYNTITSQKHFYTKENSNLPSNEVEQVAKSNITNDIWIGTYDNGLARWNGADFDVIAYPSNFGLLYKMKFGPDGNLYLQSNNGAYKYNISTQAFTKFNETNLGVWLYDAWSFDFNSAGNLVVFTGTTCIVTDINTLQIIDSFSTLTTPIVIGCSPNTSTIFNLDVNNVMFIRGTFEVGILHRDGTSTDASTGLPVFNYIDVMRGEDHLLHALVDNQFVYKWVSNTWQYEYALLPSDYATHIYYENGTQSCINIVSSLGENLELDWYTHNSSNMHNKFNCKKYVFDSNNMTSIYKDNLDNIYTVTSTNIYKFNKSTDDWSLHLTAPSIFGVVRSVRWYNGKIYADNYGNLIEFYNGSTWTQIPKASGATSGYVYSYDVTENDVVYFNNDEGFFKYASGVTTNLIPTNSSNPSTWFTTLKYDASRNIVWLSHPDMIIKYDIASNTHEIIDHTMSAELPISLNINTIKTNPFDNSVWFLENNNRMIKFDGLHYTIVTVPDADLNFINDIKFMNDNHIVVTLTNGSTGNGFYSYNGSTWTKFHSSINAEIVCNAYNDFIIDNEGSFWFSHNCDVGVSVFKNATAAIKTDVANIDLLNVYPNPANDLITINTEAINADKVQILNLHAQVVKEIKIVAHTNTIIHTSDLNNGIYIVKVGNASQKLFVAH
jgi:hypothetical protein